MSSIGKYRHSENNKEILRLLQSASEHQEHFIWQNNLGKRKVIPVKKVEIDYVSRGLNIYYDQSAYGLSHNLPVYSRLNFFNLVFKSKRFNTFVGGIYVDFPKEVRLIQQRKVDRTVFHDDDFKTVTIHSINATGRFESHEMQVRVADISKDGMGVLMNEFNRSYVKEHPLVWLKKLQNIELPEPIIAETVYSQVQVTNAYTKNRKRDLRVGYKFSTQLCESLFDEFTAS